MKDKRERGGEKKMAIEKNGEQSHLNEAERIEAGKREENAGYAREWNNL